MKKAQIPIVNIFNSARMVSLWSNLKDALKGKENDYTDTPLKKAIFLLSVPMILEMMMESIFAVVDIFFVSKIGAGAVAVVGITESMITVIYSVSIGLSIATTAMVSRRIGEKNPKGASIAAVQGIVAGFSVSLIFSLIGLLFSKDLLRLMGTDPAVIETAGGYTTVMFSTNMVIVLLFIINAVLGEYILLSTIMGLFLIVAGLIIQGRRSKDAAAK